RQLSSDPQMRARLVNSRDDVMKEAAGLVPGIGAVPQPPAAGSAISSQMLVDAMKELVSDPRVQSITPGLSSLALPDSFSSKDAAENWLSEKANITGDRKRDLVAKYEQLLFARVNKKMPSRASAPSAAPEVLQEAMECLKRESQPQPTGETN